MTDLTRQDGGGLISAVKTASESGEVQGRLASVEELKALSLRQRDTHTLADMVTSGANPAWRTTAAQVLGYHGCAGRFTEARQRLSEHVKKEPDLVVAKSIAFALAGTEGAWICLESRWPEVQAEAMAGIPLTHSRDWSRALEWYFRGLPEEAEQVFLRRSEEDRDIVGHVVEFLLTAEFPETTEDPVARVAALFRVLDQGALFSALTRSGGQISRTYREIWPGLVRRERSEVLAEILEEDVRKRGALPSIVPAIIAGYLEAPDLRGGPAKLAHRLLACLDEPACRRLVAECRAVLPSADDQALRGLSDLLAALIRISPATASDAEAVLAEWEERLPGMRLKAYHAKLAAG